MKIIQTNILKIKKGIIAHQVNQLGIMGGGMANGDWKEVFRIIETVGKELNIEFYICKREAD